MKLTRREMVARLGGAAVVIALLGGAKVILTDEERRQASDAGPDAGADAAGHGGPGPTASSSTTAAESRDDPATTAVEEVSIRLVGSIGATTVPRGTTASITGDLELQGDLVVEGLLTGVDTFTLKGNGHQVEVRNGGRLDLKGVPKTGWTREDKPSGWSPGDRVATAPNQSGQFDKDDFVIEPWPAPAASVQLVDGRNMVAEQFNLDRSIVLDDVSRIMFHDGAGQQVLKHLAVRNGGRSGELGFYPIHFHLNGDASRESLVEGVVVEGGNNHAFVPHGSHGITFVDCVAFDTTGEAFWYDPPPEARSPVNNSNDTTWDHCLAAYVSSSDDRGYRLSAFTLGAGSGNRCTDCTAVGVQGQKDSSGFTWPEGANDNLGGTVWKFEGCVSHNNRAQGIFTWQNDSGLHPIEDFVAYRNGDTGIDHGAYVNRYHYSDLTLSENGSYSIQSHALGRGEPIVFENVRASEPLLISKHVLEGSPVIYRNVSVPRVIVDEKTDDGEVESTQIFEDCGLSPSDFDLRTVANGTVIEIREGGTTTYRWDGSWQ